MSNLNRVLLMGRLTRDPELRYTPQGTQVSEVGLAINREYTVGTERRKETTFVEVVFWKRSAELICQYLKKGSPVFVEGRLAFDSWEAPDGQKRSRLRVVAENFQFLGSRADAGAGSDWPEEAGAANQGGGNYAQPSRQKSGWEPGGARSARPQGPAGPPPAQEEEPAKSEEGPLGLPDSELPF